MTNLTNIKTLKRVDNSRTKDEVERIHQLFCLYSFKTEFLYMSDTRQKNKFEYFLKGELEKEFHIKDIYKTSEEFLKILSQVKKISFTEIDDIFNQDSKQRKALTDLTGTDTPKKFTIEATYNTHRITSFLQTLFLKQKEHSLRNLIVKGLDNQDFPIIFNNETFTKKIELPLDEDENGKFKQDEVKNDLLREIDYER